MHEVDYGEVCSCQTPGFYVEGRCWGIIHAFENYVSILGSDLQNLAMFTLFEIKNLTVLKHSLVSVFVIKVFSKTLKMHKELFKNNQPTNKPCKIIILSTS